MPESIDPSAPEPEPAENVVEIPNAGTSQHGDTVPAVQQQQASTSTKVHDHQPRVQKLQQTQLHQQPQQHQASTTTTLYTHRPQVQNLAPTQLHQPQTNMMYPQQQVGIQQMPQMGNFGSYFQQQPFRITPQTGSAPPMYLQLQGTCSRYKLGTPIKSGHTQILQLGINEGADDLAKTLDELLDGFQSGQNA
ncbi:hypothetical protein SARC_07209 [Sphaeroforma arctica JP610]|uniref:Uncharacterized protein n=1 Tax=Sphaeroforma arctica JP610 TaxID=667725 RepID=A0A0L0FV32_9EUKA|nr:hypothetical protein SARC_07209 [Sphaeroforma arctica JP610]KNC80421.1 hypothetical protein SARC_07209 [Sphaeroforma arctica JP610]|eukprot:XP_014154323.1 hypothetical protein SARC_07209 [Sphaeroforma arctica JP610]